VVESLGIDAGTAEALGIGYAGKGMMKGYVAVPVRLPTGELTGYIGITLASGEDRGGIALGPSSRLTVSDVELAPIPGQEFI
jgi:hypothetical protein